MSSPLIVTPTDVSAYIVRVDRSVESLDDDIQMRRSALDPAFYHAWTGWYGTWGFFRDDYLDHWFTKNPYHAWDETAQYEADLLKWRQGFTARGGRPTAPGTGDRPRTSPLGDIGDLGKTLAILVGLGLAAYLVLSTKGKT